MTTINLDIELTPDQLTRLLTDLQSEPVPNPATPPIGYYEEKLAEAEATIHQRDNQLAVMERLQKERDHLRKVVKNQQQELQKRYDKLQNSAGFLEGERNRRANAEQELDHLRNCVASLADNLERIFERIEHQRKRPDREQAHKNITMYLNSSRAHLNWLLKEAKHDQRHQ